MANNMNLVDALQNNRGSKRGVRFIYSASSEEFLAYGELYESSLKLLGALQNRGIKPGEEMVFQIEDNKTFILLFWACLMGGIIPVPVTVGNNDEFRTKIAKIWGILKSPHLACTTKMADQLYLFMREKSLDQAAAEIMKNSVDVDVLKTYASEGVIEDRGTDDIAFIQFSSGSTGDPKGVVLTHGNLLANIEGMSRATNMTQEDSYFCWMPTTHDMGLIAYHLNPLVNNLNQYFMSTSLFIRRPMLWLQKACEHKATTLSSPNFGYKYMLDHFSPEDSAGLDLSSVRILANGAEPISVEICDQFMAAMSKYGLKNNVMYPVYGLAEASVAVAFSLPGEELIRLNLDRRFLSVGDNVQESGNKGAADNSIIFVSEGYPLHNCQLRIHNEAGEILNDNFVGYIQIKGDNVTKGYYNNEAATKIVLASDGWLNTGDLGFMRAGMLVVTGRAKDIIFMNGQNFYPHDIERIAESLEGLGTGDAAACGIFNREQQKEELVIFIQTKSELEKFMLLAGKIRTYVNVRLGIEAANVIPVKKLPKTTSGKLQRYKLVQMYENGDFSEITAKIQNFFSVGRESRQISVPRDILESDLCEIYGQVIGLGRISTDDNIFDLGAGSLQLAQIAEQLERKYPGRVAVTDLFKYTTVGKLAEFMGAGQSIRLPLTLLPDDFYLNGQTGAGTDIINLCLNTEVSENLCEMAKMEKADVPTILLALYTYMISKISITGSAAVQAMTESSGRIVSINMKREEAAGFSDLIADIKQKAADGAPVYSMREMSKIQLSRENSGVLLFFGTEQDFGIKLQEVYDIVFEVLEEEDGIKFTIRYNGNRLKKEKVFALFDNYAGLIAASVEKYGLQTAGAGM